MNTLENTTLPPAGSARRATERPTLEAGLSAFLRGLEGLNRSPQTVRAYATDIGQFIGWIHRVNAVALFPSQIVKADITEYLTSLNQRGVTGLSRARKLAAIR